MEGAEGHQDLSREASSFQELVEAHPADLVETLEDVGGATRSRIMHELRKLNAHSSEVPSILSADRSSGSSKEVHGLPIANPWSQMLESDAGIEPVDLMASPL